MKPSLTVIISALNEEGNLQSAVRDVEEALGNQVSSYEMIIINDGSCDRTGAVADRLAARSSSIRVIHHKQNQGLGASILEGYREASKEYVMWYPGDNGVQKESLKDMLRYLGQAEIVIPYIANPTFRSPSRQFLSQAYVGVLNLLFGLKLRYYNGVNIYRTALVKELVETASGFGFFAQTLILLVKGGHSYVEVPTYHRQRKCGHSKAFRWENLWDVGRTIIQLLFQIQGKPKKNLRTAADNATP